MPWAMAGVRRVGCILSCNAEQDHEPPVLKGGEALCLGPMAGAHVGLGAFSIAAQNNIRIILGCIGHLGVCL